MGFADNELQGGFAGKVRRQKEQAQKHHAKKKSGGSGGSGILDLLDSGDLASNLAMGLERQANNLGGSATGSINGGGGASPYDQLQQQLFDSMNAINIQPTPLEQLRQMAEQQVGSQFDPLISALKGQMETHTNRAQESQHTAHDMYGALSKDMLAQLPALTEQYNAMDQATNQRYDQSQQMMQGQYEDQSNKQDAILRRLGVQAASQPASQQAQDDQKYFQNSMELSQNQALDALNSQENSAKDYQRSLGSNAKFAGQNRVNDIGNMLEDYLSGAENQMTGLRSQKSQALQALLAQMQNQDSQRVQSQTQDARQNLMDMFNFQLDATKAGDKANGGANSLFKGTTGMSGASNMLAQDYPDSPILASNLLEHVQSVLQNPDVAKGKFVLDPGDPSTGKSPTYSNVGQQYMVKLLRDSFQNDSNYNNQNINDAVDALLAYLGKAR